MKKTIMILSLLTLVLSISCTAQDKKGDLQPIKFVDTGVDSEAWVVDPSGFGMSYLRRFVDKDTTSDGYDGIKRTLLGEFTFEFKNVASRVCRIKALSGGVEGSATATTTG